MPSVGLIGDDTWRSHPYWLGLHIFYHMCKKWVPLFLVLRIYAYKIWAVATIWHLDNCRLGRAMQPPFKLRILKRLAKALIRLRVCAGWSDALLIAHTTLFEISCTDSIIHCKLFHCILYSIYHWIRSCDRLNADVSLDGNSLRLNAKGPYTAYSGQRLPYVNE